MSKPGNGVIAKVGEKVVYGMWAPIVWLELGRPVVVAHALQPSGQHATDKALSVAGGEGAGVLLARSEL